MRSFADLRRASAGLLLTACLIGPDAAAQARKVPSRPAGPPAVKAAATITAIRRESLPDAVRVTVELDREVVFTDERIEGPARVFLDLPGTAAATALKDKAFTFEGDVVRHVRLGRPSPGLTRIVLDLDGAGRYSVYPRYSPFRLVIDVERPKAAVPVRAEAPAPAPMLPAMHPARGHLATAPRIGAAPAPPVPRIAAIRPLPPPVLQPLPARAAAIGHELSRGAASPVALPGGAWVPDPLPARSIALARAASIRPLPGTETRAAARVAAPLPLPVPAAAQAAVDLPPGTPASNTAGGYSLSRQLGLGVSRVVIDAGHGGHDPGARVKGLNEADLVLDIALRLEKLLKAQRGVEVVLTRRGNVFIPLEERTAIANREGADLFLSIHANASENPKARGLETYYLNFAPNPEAERIAARENAGSARTMHALPEIVKAIALNNKIDESRDFAGQVQTAMVDRLRKANTSLKDLGVKQAPFMVLIGATMPSILAEVSFITNDDEGQLLKTSDYRQHIADALFQGIQRYQRGLKANQRLAAQ